MALAMAVNGLGLKENDDGEEHEEGEISDEEPPPHPSESDEQLESSSHVKADDEAVVPAAAVAATVSAAAAYPQPLSERDPPPLLRKQVGLDEMAEQGRGTSELKTAAAYMQQSRTRDAYAGRIDLDVAKEEDRGKSRKRTDWGGSYPSTLYNFAWAQGVSGRPSGFATAGDSPSISPSSKVSTEGLSSSGSGGLGSWSSTENYKKLSREYSRDLESYGRSAGRSSEERDDMSPLRENASRPLERLSSERDATNRGRRIIRETSWSGKTERFVTVKRIEERERAGGLAENDDYRRGQPEGNDEGGWRKQRSQSGSPNGRLDVVEESRGRSPSEVAVQAGQNARDNDGNEEREEGELEEGEIELGSLPDPRKSDSAPSTKEPPNSNRQQNKYSGGMKTGDYWPKDKSYVRSLSSKSQPSRSQIDDYASRNRHRQAKLQESHREKRLTLAGELVKNVTVKDAQKSFVDVCGRLCKSLRVLDELHAPPTSRQSGGGLQDGQLSLPREITSLARQAFAGIRAVYAVRNTASGKEQERDKNVFPRLLELANGVCQKLFTPKQTRELEVMMQTIANAGRLVRDGAEKGQYPREHQLMPVSDKKSNDNNDAKPDNSLGNNNIGSVNISASTENKSGSELSVAGRLLGVVDAKQAEEAAAIAAAALAYAQSSAAARAAAFSGSFDIPQRATFSGNFDIPQSSAAARATFSSSFDIRTSGASVQGVGAWGFPSQVQQFNIDPRNLSTANKYQPPLNGTEQQRPIKMGHDGYGGHFGVEHKGHETGAPKPALLQGTTNGDLNAPPGYNKPPATSVGTLEDEWEQLSPPGAGKSSYGRFTAASGVQPAGVQKDSAAQGNVWGSSRVEMGTVPAFQNTRGPAAAAPAYPPEHLLNLTQQRNRANANMYSTERLPSPTPDEDDMKTSVAPVLPPPPPSLETKPNSLDVVGKEPKVITVPLQGGANVAMSMLLPGSIHNLIRSHSLDGPGPGIDAGMMQKGKPKDLSLLAGTRALDHSESMKTVGSIPLPGNFGTRALDHSESMKTVGSIPLPGNFRSRDPRRRLQSSSVDLTDIGGLDLSSQVVPGPNLSLGEAIHVTGIDRNKKRMGLDLDGKQDSRLQKRVKVQSDSNVDVNGFTLDSLHAASGTGGWLDDNHVPSFTSSEELPIAMDVDDDSPFTAPEGRNGLGSDGMVDSEGQLDFFPDFGNNVATNKKQKVDAGQQMGESGQRKMKSRDPRRVFLESHIERGDSSSSGDTVKPDGKVPLDPRKAEGSLAIKATAEAPARSDKETIQASKQGANIAPQFIAGVAASSSPQAVKCEQPVNSDGAHIMVSGSVTDGSAGDGRPDAEVISVPSESVAQELPEQQLKDKSAAASVGPRKPKGSPSQWGASQVHPHLEQLLGDLSEDDRRSVQLERQRRMEEQDRMFSAGKLCLVLDLDHTLLNSAKFSEIEPEWDQRLRVAESAERNRTARDGVERRELYRFPHMSMWTKLRPGIWKFLARASQLYELHVYTMGNKVYATEMAKLLDPTGKLFAGRVISKGDDGDGDDLLPKSKDLDGVLGMESAVVIIDDSARVWPHHSENLIVVERYMYFPCSRRQFGLGGPSLLEVGHDERESDGMLASALGVIDRIHQNFFNHPKLREVDVREILAAQQRSVLAGCKVVFSRVFPVGEAEPHRHPLWRTAEQFGAICTITIDDQVTHVVAISLGTDKVNWALETGRYVVRPAWLEASTILYRRANERDFPVLPQ